MNVDYKYDIFSIVNLPPNRPRDIQEWLAFAEQTSLDEVARRPRIKVDTKK